MYRRALIACFGRDSNFLKDFPPNFWAINLIRNVYLNKTPSKSRCARAGLHARLFEVLEFIELPR